MRILWKLAKVVIGLAIAIPVAMVALAMMFGILGTVLGLAFVALKIACVGLVGYGLFRVAKYVFAPAPKPAVARELPAGDQHGDRYYEAAMRELDSELGLRSGR
jgi:hypothetical protein